MHTQINDPIQGIIVCRAGRLHCGSDTKVYIKKRSARVTDRIQGIVFAGSSEIAQWQRIDADNRKKVDQKIAHGELSETIRAATDDLMLDELEAVAASELFRHSDNDARIRKRRGRMLRSFRSTPETPTDILI